MGVDIISNHNIGYVEPESLGPCILGVKLQRRTMQIIILSKYHAHIEPLYQELKLLEVKELFDVQCMIFLQYFTNCSLPNCSVLCSTITTTFILSQKDTIAFTYSPRESVGLVWFWGNLYQTSLNIFRWCY